jgi:16S rRNA (uracil1498-N3)-methyltransferase
LARPRFFVDLPLQVGVSAGLPPDVAHHAVRVLRLSDGAPITLFDGRGGEYAAKLRITGSQVAAAVERFDPVERESPLALTLIQAMVASEKLDWIVEKAVELGAARVVVVPTQRSVVRLDAARTARRLQHWRDLARAACCQCGRNRVPQIEFCASIDAAVHAVPEAGARLLLHPAAAHDLPTELAGGGAVILVGAEGGLTDAEVARATNAGFVATRLGPRVLRTETAGLAALAALQARCGDLATAPR